MPHLLASCFGRLHQKLEPKVQHPRVDQSCGSEDNRISHRKKNGLGWVTTSISFSSCIKMIWCRCQAVQSAPANVESVRLSPLRRVNMDVRHLPVVRSRVTGFVEAEPLLAMDCKSVLREESLEAF